MMRAINDSAIIGS